MNKKGNNYFYKTCDLDKMNSLDKKRYEYLNEFGYNFDSNSKRIKDLEEQFKKQRYN